MADQLIPSSTGIHDLRARFVDAGDGTWGLVAVSRNYVWNVGTGVWEKMTQPAAGGGGVDPVGLKNTSAVAINPATEDTLATRLAEATFTGRIGEVQASPTQYTLLERLKVLATLLNGGLPAALTAGGGLKTGLVDALPAGSANIGDVDVASGPTGASALQVQGTAAHDAAAAGNPLQTGGVAESTYPAAVVDGDAVRAWFDLLGRMVMQVGSGQFSDYAGEFTSNQTGASLITAPGAGLSIVVYDIVVSTGTAGKVTLLDDTTAKVVVNLAANGGFVFNSAKGWKLTANKALKLTSTTVAGPLDIFVNYAVVP